MPDPVRFTLNDRPVTLDTDPSRTLLWVLRTDLELTGTKYGCGVGQCGSCTVVLDGQAVRACQTRLRDVAGKRVTTIEGLARDGTLHPLQEAFAEHGGFQCGYCTPGMIMSAYAMVQATPAPSTARIVEGLEGNLCRCGAHQRIVEAIATVTHGGVGGDHD
jgi:aerobic-type carbon monoxide dehydrogenase small subunit (CoxS/CutS family)